MNQEIQDFLQQPNPDFHTGFGLFCKYSPNQSLMSWIGRKGDMETLLYELKKLNRYNSSTINVNASIHEALYNKIPKKTTVPEQPVSADAPEHKGTVSEIVFKTIDERRTRRGDLPADLQAVYDEISSDYKLRRGLHEKMKQASTDADRASYRARILETQERIEKGWKRIDSYLLEAEKEKVNAKFNESNCRAYISKALKSETISDKVAAGVRIRVKALYDNGYSLSDETKAALKDRNIF